MNPSPAVLPCAFCGAPVRVRQNSADRRVRCKRCRQNENTAPVKTESNRIRNTQETVPEKVSSEGPVQVPEDTIGSWQDYSTNRRARDSRQQRIILASAVALTAVLSVSVAYLSMRGSGGGEETSGPADNAATGTEIPNRELGAVANTVREDPTGSGLVDSENAGTNPGTDANTSDVSVRDKESGNASTTTERREFDSPAELASYVDERAFRLNLQGATSAVIGSGFVVSSTGLAVTNFHVIEDMLDGEAQFPDGRVAKIGGVRAYEEDRDIAVIQLEIEPLSEIRLASDQPVKGTEVFAFGSPRGLSFTISEGIVSAIRSAEELESKESGIWLQTTAPISGGSSGGPLVNWYGEVVGMNTLTRVDGQNLNFAVSASDISELVTKAAENRLVLLSEMPGASTRTGSGRQPIRSSPIVDPAQTVVESSELDRKIAQEVMTRTDALDSIETEVKKLLAELKEGILAGDRKKIEELEKRIREKRKVAEAHVTRRFDCLPQLFPERLSVGESGTLIEQSIQILETFPDDVVLVRFLRQTSRPIALIRGMRVLRVRDGSIVRILGDTVFHAELSRTVRAKSSRKDDIVQIAMVGSLSQMLAPIKDRFDTMAWEPRLTVEEKKIADENNAGELRQRKIQAAAAKLDRVERLIKLGKTENVKKWLREIIEDASGTETEKKARNLLQGQGGDLPE